MTKTCSKCDTDKPLAEFNVCKAKKDGFHSYCKVCDSESSRIYREKNKERILKQRLQYRQKNRKKLSKISQEYYEANKDSVREYKLQWERNRRANNPAFRLRKNLARRLHRALSGDLKAAPTKELLGCSYEYACQHLENQFTEGMTWDNWAIDGWHVDHIMPLASYDLRDPDQQKEANHYTNLQPLWARDNLRKSDKLPHEL